MLARLTSVLVMLSIFSVAINIRAQEPVQTIQASSVAVTATVTDDGGVRVTSPGQTLAIHVEVYDAGGQLVFDSGARQGNIIDWKQDPAKVLADGIYAVVVTVKDFQGNAKQRLGSVTVQAGQLTLARKQGLTPAQTTTLDNRRKSQKIESDDDDSITVLRAGRERSAVVTAHDGVDGQVTSTTGDLTLRTGDTLSGQDKEQVRVTQDGRVGIGTNQPQATLDVNGEIRTQGGIRFADGTTLTTAGDAKKSDDVSRNLAGTGSANRITKWVDGAGTLGDSVMTETSGRIGIGTATPTYKMVIGNDLGAGLLTADLTVSRGAGQSVSTYVGASGSQGIGFGWNANSNNGFVNAPDGAPFSFTQGGVNERMRIHSNGNVGIGTSTPSYNLVVGPDIGPGLINAGLTVSRGVGQSASVFVGPTGANGINFGWDQGNTRGFVNAPDGSPFAFTNGGVNERMRIHTNGFVGINNASPTERLDVGGNIKLTGAGSKLIFPDGTFMTTAATGSGGGGGGAMTGTSIVSAINDPGTFGVIGDNRLSANIPRLGSQNFWNSNNIFVNGLSANNVAITNVGNPVSATDAANKNYVDTSAIKFVPNTFQLSVGDANGTAPMMFLRGGSTCCSGPGGYTPADFKVYQNGSFVATGNLGIGVSPMQGKGYRTSWDSYKGAFRSGYADTEWDDNNVGFFSWAGGSNSTAIGLYGFAFGDTNTAESTSSIAFGSGNQVKGAAGFSAGAGNRVCDTYGVALGNKAQSGGPLINGRCDPDAFNLRGLAAIAIGYNVTADQDHTLAFGKFASNNGFSGTFIWSDASAQASADTFRNTANNEFAARATGGFRFRTNLTGTTGCNLPAGSGVFNCTSSRLTKENFLIANGSDVLSTLRKMPVSTWNYIAEGSAVRHMGPMAEDFYKGFGLGTGNTSIGVQDLAGVSLAAIKELDQRTIQLQQKNVEVEQLRSQVNDLRLTNNSMEKRLAALEQLVKQNSRPRHRRK
ncbi:MAG TPA: tail fiber domain-containing protein [Pyrinomonadaceae bacterium]